MLNVGVDSYVSLEDANAYIESHYTSSNKFRTAWSNMSDSDKEALLRSSTQAIDTLKFNGRKRLYNQVLQFPRVLASNIYYGMAINGEVNQYADLSCSPVNDSYEGGLKLVKQAVIENSLAASTLEKNVNNQMESAILGITSKRIGPIAETYNRQTTEARGARRGIYSDKVYSLLAPWLSDSFMSL